MHLLFFNLNNTTKNVLNYIILYAKHIKQTLSFNQNNSNPNIRCQTITLSSASTAYKRTLHFTFLRKEILFHGEMVMNVDCHGHAELRKGKQCNMSMSNTKCMELIFHVYAILTMTCALHFFLFCFFFHLHQKATNLCEWENVIVKTII